MHALYTIGCFIHTNKFIFTNRLSLVSFYCYFVQHVYMRNFVGRVSLFQFIMYDISYELSVNTPNFLICL